jgi:hypothetical protein
MSEVDISILCKAIIQQGTRKGEQCQKNRLENGYCIYHKRNYEYEYAINNNIKICGMFFRGCNNELTSKDIDNSYKNCKNCREKKSGKSYPCQYNECSYKIKNKDDKYCKKHIRHLLRDNEIENKIKYCDIDRGCFNKIISEKKCEECKSKEIEEVALEIDILRKKYSILYPNIINSSRLHIKQEENIINVSELWRGLQRNAYSRGLLFNITEIDFEKIIIQPCYYCGFYSKSRLNSIDRIDNNKGYMITNCITSCKMCNMIKNKYHPNEFLDKIFSICNYTNNNIDIDINLIKKWKSSYLTRNKRVAYEQYKNQSKMMRNIEFLLSEKEYNNIISGKCYLCGIKNQSTHSNGIDRIDSSLRIYSLENSRTCCGHCNIMKGSLTYSDFIDKCNQINMHKCDRNIFNMVPIYDYSQCRNEYYTAEDIFNMIIHGKYSKYLEWCQEKEKSPEFISSLNLICNIDKIHVDNKSIIIKKIQEELDIERHRKSNNGQLENKKILSCTTLYSYLTQGKLNDFKEWYNQHYIKSTLFDEQLDTLINSLPTIDKDKGIEACKKFMYDEKNRRNTQQRREHKDKVIKYTTKSSLNISDNIDSDDKHITKNIIVYPKYKSESVPITLENKIKDQQNIIGYEKKTIDNLKQWKVKQIYEAITLNNENQYKEFCEQNNDISKIDNWEAKWVEFILSIKSKSIKDSEKIIRAFLEDLRRLRHNELCYNRNSNIIDRENRQQWPSTTVLRAYKEGRLGQFKEFQENYTGIADMPWQFRWNKFIEALDKSVDDSIKLEIIKKFMATQRIRVYRSSKD